MKIKIMFKDPDGVSEAIRELAQSSVNDLDGISEDEKETLAEKRQEEYAEALQPWIGYGEYLEVEFDTVAHTVTVIKPK